MQDERCLGSVPQSVMGGPPWPCIEPRTVSNVEELRQFDHTSTNVRTVERWDSTRVTSLFHRGLKGSLSGRSSGVFPFVEGVNVEHREVH